MENILEKIPLVDILNTGLAGFCFLIALLGYLLLRHEQKKGMPNRTMLRSIESFVKKSFLLGILVGLCTIAASLIERNNFTKYSASVTDFTKNLPRLVRSNDPLKAKQSIEIELAKLVKLAHIPKLEAEIQKLSSENVLLSEKIKSFKNNNNVGKQNFFIKIANLNSKITEFGGTSINPFYPFNSKKREVNKMIQDLLAELNQYTGEIDGDRHKTRDALVAYQSQKGFTTVGFLAFPTIKAMLEEYLYNAGRGN